MSYFKGFLLYLILTFICKCSCWGNLGHRTVALVAEKHLSLPAKTYLWTLLGNDDLSDASIWADTFKNTKEGAYTSGWHFLNTHDDPPITCRIDLEVDCLIPESCLVSAIANMVRVFPSPTRHRSQIRRSLSYRTRVCFGPTIIRQ